MATLLSLVKDVGRDTGTLPNWASLATLVGASERAQKITAWVVEAWTNIQNEREDWLWMRGSLTSALVIDQTGYAPASAPFSLTRWGDWLEDDPYGFSPVTIYDPAEGVDDEIELAQIDYFDWLAKYGRGSHDANRPIDWAIGPDGQMLFGPKPDKAYVIKALYQKSPQTLAVDGDTPEMPVRFHNLIKWEAIRLLQIADGGWNEMGAAANEIATLRSRLNREQLPQIRLDGVSL